MTEIDKVLVILVIVILYGLILQWYHKIGIISGYYTCLRNQGMNDEEAMSKTEEDLKNPPGSPPNIE